MCQYCERSDLYSCTHAIASSDATSSFLLTSFLLRFFSAVACVQRACAQIDGCIETFWIEWIRRRRRWWKIKKNVKQLNSLNELVFTTFYIQNSESYVYILVFKTSSYCIRHGNGYGRVFFVSLLSPCHKRNLHVDCWLHFPLALCVDNS